MDDAEIEKHPDGDMELDEVHPSSTTPAKVIRKTTASSNHQPKQKRHKGDSPTSGSG